MEDKAINYLQKEISAADDFLFLVEFILDRR